ncbi:rhodanese-like domain-containing protein [Cribrihabitans neustonicus]|uniref:rhodanese-like domain-containing protein n=1 Tax=Cribrihabitans neustonicus TaxID=1429085 RepID=UPI003B5A7426
MTKAMTKSSKDLIAEAEAVVPCTTVADALAAQARPKTKFIDLRVIREVERTGTIDGAFSCPRGMLEFWIDPESPYHKPIFASDRRFIFYCDNGWRSALAAKTAMEMGLQKVSYLQGGFEAWIAAGGAAAPYRW